MKAPYSKQERQLEPAGTFMARVVGIVYLGTQDKEWKGERKETPEIRITFELPTETHVLKEGELAKPFTISNIWTHAMGNKSNLRPITEAIIGTSFTDDEAYGFDHDSLIGLPCQLTVSHVDKNGKTYANITSVSAVLKGVTVPPQVNASKLLSFDKWDENVFRSLPIFVREKIESSPEYAAMTGKNDGKDDGIPF